MSISGMGKTGRTPAACAARKACSTDRASSWGNSFKIGRPSQIVIRYGSAFYSGLRALARSARNQLDDAVRLDVGVKMAFWAIPAVRRLDEQRFAAARAAQDFRQRSRQRRLGGSRLAPPDAV